MTTVLMTTDAVGGVWTYSLDLSRALAGRGADVVLAIIGPGPSDAQRAELAGCPVAAVHELPYALEWTDDPWADVDEAAARLLELEADVRPDVMHLNGYGHGSRPWSAPVVVVAHSDVLSWWRAVHGEPAPARWDEYARRVGAGLASADAVVAPTRAVLDAMAVEFGPVVAPDSGAPLGGPLVRVIPNGRSGDWVVDRRKEPMILSAGRLWDPAKNIAALAAVAPSLDWPIYVAGEDRADDQGSGDQGSGDQGSGDQGSGEHGSRGGGPLRGLGRLGFDELATYIAAAAIYASPARYEPFGLAAVEAGLAGCALVLGDIASLREVWGDAAVYVPPDDHAALLDALAGLIEDPSRRRELGRRARQTARRYDIVASADAYLDLYRSLGHAPRRRSSSRDAVGAPT